MSSIKLIIRTNKSSLSADGKSLIFIRYCHRNKQTLLSTGENIPVASWDKKRQEVKKSFRGFTALNDCLNSMTADILKTARNAKANGVEPTVDYIKKAFRSAKNNETDKPELMAFIDKFIEAAKETRRNGTVKGYRVTFNHLSKYEKHRGVKLTYDKIDMRFYHDFKEYFTKVIGNGTSAFGTKIKHIKLFMNAAFEQRLHSCDGYKTTKFKAPEEQADTIYLTEIELRKMYDLDLSENPRMEKVRDLFLVGCFTGLRFSDFTQIKKQHFIADTIQILTQKTSQKVIIPLHPIVRQIMKKYAGLTENSLPPSISNQKMNKYIKELGKLAGLIEIVIVTKNVGGVRKECTYKKYELIMTHCARRSFATNLFLSGFPSLNIMKITSHKTESAFMKYIRVTEEQAAELLKQHWNKEIHHLQVVA